MDGLIYVSRGSFGISLNFGVEKPEEITSLNLDPKINICRSLKFSNNGQYLCYCDSSRTVLIESSTGKEVYAMDDLSKTQQIMFSPRDTSLITYEPYAVYSSRLDANGKPKKPKPNLNFYSVVERKHLKVFIVTKQSTWRPQFSDDESTMLRQSDQGLFFYNNLNFENPNKVQIKDLESFSISPGNRPHLVCFIPGLKGQPALIQLREISEGLPVLFSKPSFNCDKCAMMWNTKGNAVLVTASVDVDKSDKSYYGVSHLYCITTKLDCFQVFLDKTGPLHAVQWSPSGKEFCVCYGFMPSKVTIFNMDGNPVWEIGEGHRNEVHYSPFGDLLVTCGFGNISSGKMSFWNVETKKEIIQHEAPLTTHFEWAPDGRHFLTATTAPRLRMSNGFRIWNYGKGVVYHKPTDKEELWQVSWMPTKAFSQPEILNLTEVEKALATSHGGGVGVNVPKSPIDQLLLGAVTKTGVYVPPAMRKQSNNSNNGNFTRPNTAHAEPRVQISEKEKKIRSLQKKLDDILKLKEKELSGITLEINQKQKILTEPQLREELVKIKVSD